MPILPPPQQPRRDPDSLPDSTDPSGPCPRCGRVSTFSLEEATPVTFVKDGRYATSREGGQERLYTERAAILQCSGCTDRIVVIEEQLVGGVSGGRSGAITHRGFNWWPVPHAGILSPDVPDYIGRAYEEGMRCVSANAPNGAVAMFRTALSFIVTEKGSQSAKDKGGLKERIEQLVADGILPNTLGSWATHVRLYGNAGAHPDLFGGVSLEEARDVASLTYTLLEVLYVIPAKIAKRQSGRPTPS